MTTSERPTFRVFETRQSEEYIRLLADALSIKGSPSATCPDLVASSYRLTDEARKKIKRRYGTHIERVINIDYVGMTANVLLDRDERYTKNTHYERLRELLASLKTLNEEGVAVKIRLLLQYPYSLAGQNRITAEFWKDRSYMGEVVEKGRDETRLAPTLTAQHIKDSELFRNQQYCLERLQHLPNVFNPGEPNKIEIRFAFISTLICGLRVNKLFFYDPYHYGRRRGESTCAYTSTPVVMIDGRDHCDAYEVFCNHFRCIWECDSTLDYHDVVCQDPGTVTTIIKKSVKLRARNKVARLRRLPSEKAVDWKRREAQLSRLVKSLCPIVPSVDAPERGFLAAAWETRGGRSVPCEPAHMLAKRFKRGFERLEDPDSVRVALLEGRISSSLPDSLFTLMDSSTFSIIMLTKEVEAQFCKPNVYFELGYLLQKNHRERTFIVVEKGMNVPSDLQHIIFLEFERTRPHQDAAEIERVYKELLRAMMNPRARIINKDTFDELTKADPDDTDTEDFDDPEEEEYEDEDEDEEEDEDEDI